jgi:hypothetical protein
MYEARSLLEDVDTVAYVVVVESDQLRELRMSQALRQIRDAPRSRFVKVTAAWGLGDMGED